MKRKLQMLKWKKYWALSEKLQAMFPEELEASVVVAPPIKGNWDMVTISFKIPHKLTRHLMWRFK